MVVGIESTVKPTSNTNDTQTADSPNVSESCNETDTDSADPASIDDGQGPFLERVGSRLEYGLTEFELACELIVEASKLAGCSYGYVLRLKGIQQLEIQAILAIDANGVPQSLNDTLPEEQPDELMQDVMATLRPAYSNNASGLSSVNLPRNHPPIHSYAVCPLMERANLKGILLIANTSSSFNIDLLSRLQTTLDAMIRVHINSVVNRGINQVVAAMGIASRQFSRLQEASFNSVITIDENAVLMSFNKASEWLFDITASDAIGWPIDRIIDKDALDALNAQPITSEPGDYADNASTDSQVVHIDNVHVFQASGKRVPVNIAFFHHLDAGRRYATLVIQERTNQRKSRADADNGQIYFNALSGLLPVGVLKLNKAWLCEYANDAWCELTGRELEQNLESGWIEALHEEDQPHILMHMRYALIKGQTFREVLRLKNAKGQIINTSINASSIMNKLNQPAGSLVVIMDISQQQQAEQQLKQLVHRDPLTGLSNRTRFLEQLDNLLAVRQSSEIVALLFIDLDGFKAVNDTIGHDAGDELLQQVARRLRHTVREEDNLARLGGDEFSVTLRTLERGEDASIVADAIVQAIKQPFLLKNEEIYVSASIGIALSVGPNADHSMDANSLIKQADVALYRAKLSGRSRHVFFTAELDQAQRERSVLITSLRRAVDRQDFELYYQPQLLIQEQQLLGFEALLRWPQALDKHISPADFIDVLEDTGLIGELGEWAIGQACSQHRVWRNRGLIGPATTMSVNVSVRQLSMPHFADSVAMVLHNQDMRPDSLILEITESALVQTFETNIIKDIKALGVQISLDDFGTGYSSLAYLSQLPLDHLKIDRSFIADIVRYPHAVTVVKSIIALANTLGIRVIAEGVEDGSVLPLLAAEGCEGYQGYFFSRPLPADQMTELLKDLDSVKLSHYANFIDLDVTRSGDQATSTG